MVHGDDQKCLCRKFSLAAKHEAFSDWLNHLCQQFVYWWMKLLREL